MTTYGDGVIVAPIPVAVNSTREHLFQEESMADLTAYFNGEWVAIEDVKIDYNDRGFRVGAVVFDVARTFNGKTFRMKEHVDRLYRSLKYARMDPGLSSEEMTELSEEVVRRNSHALPEVGDFAVRQMVTRGHGSRATTAGPPTVIVMAEGIDYGNWGRNYRQGAHGVITRTRSYSAEALDPKIKHHSRMNFDQAELEAADVDPEGWAILMDTNGNISEGPGWNVFIVTDGVMRTPGDGSVLQGVSRGTAVDLARQLDIPVVEEELQPYDLYTADEAFFTSTFVCVMPVTRIDNRQIGEGQPGPVTRQLLATWSETVGIDIVDQMERFAGISS